MELIDPRRHLVAQNGTRGMRWLSLSVLSVLLLAQNGWSEPMMLAREGLTDTTTIVQDGRANAVIVYPDEIEGYPAVVGSLQAALEAGRYPILETHAVGSVGTATGDSRQPPRVKGLVDGLFLPEDLKHKNLILLGNLNDNRAFNQLAANLQVYSTCKWPGNNGYEFRTITNPFGTKNNCIVLGGSDVKAVQRAADRLIALINANSSNTELTIPRQLEIVLNGEPQDRLEALPPQARDVFNGTYRLGEAVERYTTSGSAAQLELVKSLLRGYLDAGKAPADEDYGTEVGMRALDLVDSFALTPEENQKMDNLILDWIRQIIQSQPYWNPSGRKWRFGGHQAAGVMSFYTAINYLLKNGNPNAEARKLLLEHQQSAREFLSYLSSSFLDEQKDVGWETFIAQTGFARYALAEQDMTCFESGTLHQVLQRIYYTYGMSAQGQKMLTLPAGFLAYVYNDGGYKSLAPEGTPLTGWAFNMQGPTWVAEDALKATSPEFLVGAHVLRSSRVNWEQASSGANPMWRTTLPWEKTFHVLGFSGGIQETDLLLVINGWDSSDSPGSANSLRMFRQEGHDFLARADGDDKRMPRPGRWYQNSLMVESPHTSKPVECASELLGVYNGSRVKLSAARLNDYHGVNWTRCLVQAPGDYFVVIDSCEIRQDGPISLVDQWYSYDPAILDGTRWTTATGAGRFVLKMADVGQAAAHDEQWDGGPFALRQRKRLDAVKGQSVDFSNLFFIENASRPDSLEIRKLSPGTILVRDTRHTDAKPAATVAMIGTGRHGDARLTIEAAAFYLSSESLALAGEGTCLLDGQPVLADGSGVLPAAEQSRLRRVLEELWDQAPAGGTAASTPAEPRTPIAQRQPLPIKMGYERAIPSSVVKHPDGSVTWRFDRPVQLRGIEGVRSTKTSVVLENEGRDKVDAPVGLLHAWVYYQYGFSADLGITTFGPLHLTTQSLTTPPGEGDPPYGRWIAQSWHEQPWNVTGMNPELFNRPFWQDVVFRTDRTRIAYVKTLCGDLDGDGNEELIAATDQDEVLILDHTGQVRWKHSFAAPITNMLVQDLDGDGKPEVMVSTKNSQLSVFDANGNTRFIIDTLAGMDPKTEQDRLRSYGRGINSMGVIDLPDGRRGLVVGTYHQVQLYDAQGKLIQFTDAAGFYEDSLPPVLKDVTGDGVADIVTRENAWGMVGLMNVPSLKLLVTGGMFAGRGLALSVWPTEPGRGGRILTVAESGIAMLEIKGAAKPNAGDASIISGGLQPIFALPLNQVCAWGLINRADEKSPIAVATRMGTVLIISQSGQVLQRTLIDGEILDMTTMSRPDGSTVVALATSRGVQLLDRSLRSAAPPVENSVGCIKLQQLTTTDGPRMVCLYADGSALVMAP